MSAEAASIGAELENAQRAIDGHCVTFAASGADGLTGVGLGWFTVAMQPIPVPHRAIRGVVPRVTEGPTERVASVAGGE